MTDDVPQIELRKRCSVEGCVALVPPDLKGWRCLEHAGGRRRAEAVPEETPRSRADAVIEAWVRADYERDQVDPSFMAVEALEALALRIEAVYQGQDFPAPPPPASGKAAKWLARGIVTPGTPRELSPAAEEPNQRAPSCIAFVRCAAIATDRGWAAWSCRGCAGPGYLTAKIGGKPGEAPPESSRARSLRSGVMTGGDGTPWG